MKPRISLSLLIFLLSACLPLLYAQSDDSSILKPVEKQLEAYNARDIEAFLNQYSDTVKVYLYPNTFMYQGKETMRKNYGQMFETMLDLHCTLVHRAVIGNTVLDQESVIFSKDAPPKKAIAIYKVSQGLIQEVRFISK